MKLIEAFLGKEIDQPNMTTLTGKPNFQVKQVADEKDKIIRLARILFTQGLFCYSHYIHTTFCNI